MDILGILHAQCEGSTNQNAEDEGQPTPIWSQTHWQQQTRIREGKQHSTIWRAKVKGNWMSCVSTVELRAKECRLTEVAEAAPERMIVHPWQKMKMTSRLGKRREAI
eukprot:4356490-Amphidinium_carterae.2